jgi:sterol desaturase/sphingolipid hydroxylase (fatty acid hydroxylase superfamily)
MHDLIQLAVPAFIALMIVEAVAGVIMHREIYDLKDSAASISMGLGNLAAEVLAKVVQVPVLTYLHRFAIFLIAFQWWAVGHHSQHYNLSSALRQTWTGSFMSFLFWLWLLIIGFAPIMIMTMKAIRLLYQFWIHTELVRSMGLFEAVLNTPSRHRVHHGANPRCIDRNHGGTLIIWDKLFGAFEPETPADPVRFGLITDIQTDKPVRIAFHEWVDMFRDAWNAPGWRNKLRYIFGNPGWRHNEVQSPL